MPKIIEVPNQGQVEFPDDMSDDQIVAAIKKNSLSYPEKSSGAMDGIKALGSGLGKGVGNVALGAQGFLGKGLDSMGLDSAGKWLQDDAKTGRERLAAEFAPYKAASPKMGATGEIGGEILATLPVGGILGKGALKAAPLLMRAGASAPAVNGLASALATGGMRTGLPAATTFAGKAANLGLRTGGGAVTGATAAGLANEENAAMGALIGGALPGGAQLAGMTGAYLGRTAKALVQPLTKNGQEGIAAKIITKFGEGGPMAVNAREIIPNSTPTLAEATGNAGIAGLQRTARDLRPNAFQALEKKNASALTSTFDDMAGDAGQLEFYKAQRAQAGKELYDKALDRVPEPATPWLKGQVTQLLKRPSINEASKKAQQWAIERGEKPYMNGSMRGLHDTKTALDDMINEATIKGQGGHAKALEATQAKLLTVMEKLSPDYAEARATYAAMSKPINEMEALQGLRVTDKKGNITLSKIQNAIKGLQNQQMQAGFNNAKSVDADKLKTLLSIRDDLMRKEFTDAGKSAGSNTFQNIATDNILGTMLPGKIGGAINSRVGDVVGQVGKLAYSGANEKIRNQLLDMMLDPALAQSILRKHQALPGPTTSRLGGLLDGSAPWAYRSAPLLGSDR